MAVVGGAVGQFQDSAESGSVTYDMRDFDSTGMTHVVAEGDRFGMLSALSHDPLQRDILTPVWVGASLHIPDPEKMGTWNTITSGET